MRAIPGGSWTARALRAVAGATAGALVAGVIVLTPGASASSTDDRIAFASDRDGDLEIFSVRPDGSDLRQLTSNQAWDTDPAWSPEGTKVAFSSDRDGDFDPDIWVMNGDGSGAVNLTDSAGRDVQPTWSPDGTRISFVRDGKIFDVATTGGGPVQRVIGVAPAWSPDGTKVTFARSGDIYVMNPNGSGVTPLTSGEEADAPEWSPDGATIAYETTATDEGDSRIRIVDVATGTVTELPGTGDDFHPSWSPDGSSLVLSNITLDAELVVVSADGTTRRTLASHAGYEVLPSWSGCVGAGCGSPTASPSDSTSPTESPSGSPTTSPTVGPTDLPPDKAPSYISLKKVKLRYRIKAVGSVRPIHHEMEVRVILAKRKNGRWVRVARKFVVMDRYGRYVTRFKYPPRTRRCRIKAIFPGDGDHLRSVKSVRFSC